MKKIYIEFIGMPASGKSFYKKKIEKTLSKDKILTNNFNFLSKILKIFFFMMFLFRYTKLTIINLNFFFFTKNNNKEFKKHFYYFKNEAALRIYHEIKKEIIINSEGFRHRAIYFIHENLKINKDFLYKNYINSLPKIDILIYIRSNKRLNISRSKKRKKSFKYNLEEIKIYKNKENIIKKITKETKKNIFLIEFKRNQTDRNMNIFKKVIKKI